jgi:hypothetical protein
MSEFEGIAENMCSYGVLLSLTHADVHLFIVNSTNA